MASLERKAGEYLMAVVWLVDTATETVVDHRSDREPLIFGEGQSLTLPGIIPDFSLSVDDVFDV